MPELYPNLSAESNVRDVDGNSHADGNYAQALAAVKTTGSAGIDRMARHKLSDSHLPGELADTQRQTSEGTTFESCEEECSSGSAWRHTDTGDTPRYGPVRGNCCCNPLTPIFDDPLFSEHVMGFGQGAAHKMPCEPQVWEGRTGWWISTSRSSLTINRHPDGTDRKHDPGQGCYLINACGERNGG